MTRLLIIGCVSRDRVHIESANGRQTYETIGGAGLHTALAAKLAGADVVLCAPKPEPMPEIFSVVERLVRWVGPTCTEQSMPALEIVHHGQGRATLLHAAWGAEEQLRPDSEDLPAFDIAHIGALSSAGKQLEFLRKCRSKQTNAIVSAGTYARSVQEHRETVLSLYSHCDLFFMNANESRLLFLDQSPLVQPKQTVFVTDGAQGATIYEGTSVTQINAEPANELDPTGAGDTFCGVTLALREELGAQEAAKRAAGVASRAIEKPGAAFLIERTA